MEPDLALAQRAATVAFNLAVALMVGTNAAASWLRRGASDWSSGQRPRLRRAMFGALALAVPAYFAILWLEAASMAEVPVGDAYPAVQSVLTATHYGVAWTIGAAALLVAAICSAVGETGRKAAWLPPLRLAALAVVLYSRSMVSHAGAGGDVSWAVAIDWTHLVLVSLWLGEVLVAGAITLRRLPAADLADGRDRARYIEALSRTATIALAGIFATGAASAWRGLGGFENVLGNPYGTTLLIKIGLVLCAAALGGVNRFTVMPSLLAQLRKDPAAGRALSRRFALVLHIEAILLAAVLAAAAFLSSTPPPSAS
jgi:putative copper resistance protein D